MEFVYEFAGGDFGYSPIEAGAAIALEVGSLGAFRFPHWESPVWPRRGGCAWLGYCRRVFPVALKNSLQLAFMLEALAPLQIHAYTVRAAGDQNVGGGLALVWVEDLALLSLGLGSIPLGDGHHPARPPREPFQFVRDVWLTEFLNHRDATSVQAYRCGFTKDVYFG